MIGTLIEGGFPLSDVERSELAELRRRAAELAATPGLDAVARAHAHAGRYVLGLAGREMKR